MASWLKAALIGFIRMIRVLSLILILSACTVRLPWTPSPLATVGEDGNVYVLHGEQKTPITMDGAGYRHPVWSHDGRLLAFLSADKTTVFMAAASGEWVREVYRSEDERPRTLGWSPDGRSLAMTTNSVSGGVFLLHVISAQTAQVRTLDAGPHLRWQWTRTGDLLVYAEDRQTRLTVEGRTLEEQIGLEPTKTVHTMLPGIAVPSPNGQRAAVFTPQPDGSFLISVVNAYTGLEIDRFPAQLTPDYWVLVQALGEWQEGLRIWSPNGHYFAVAQLDGEASGLWAYPAVGDEAPRRLGDGVEVSWFWR